MITVKDYIIISPVKDEEDYIETIIHSVLKQSVKPVRWIIVNDGSQDRTGEIIEKYCKEHYWIKHLKIERSTERQPGSAVINAFNYGYQDINDTHFDFIVKLDCDLRFEHDYFEKIIFKLNENESLGIISGVYLEKRGRDWLPVKMPKYHAAGACKVVRKKCFKDIGGFVAARGWDTVDEIRAQLMGWKTCHFEEIEFYHLKNEGSGIGSLKTSAMHGEIFYLTGGSKLFFFLKFFYRAFIGKPFLLGGLIMFLGYLKPMLLRKKLLLTYDEVKLYKKLMYRRMLDKLR